jgi:hypothetical protein
MAPAATSEPDTYRNQQLRMSRQFLTRNSPLLEVLMHMVGREREQIVDDLVVNIGQHQKNGFYVVRAIESILIAYGAQLPWAMVGDVRGPTVEYIRLFFDPSGSKSMTFEHAPGSGSFEVRDTSDTPPMGDTPLIEWPTVQNLRRYLKSMYLYTLRDTPRRNRSIAQLTIGAGVGLILSATQGLAHPALYPFSLSAWHGVGLELIGLAIVSAGMRRNFHTPQLKPSREMVAAA